jgi:hypothetical protein
VGYPQSRSNLARTLAFLNGLPEKVSFQVRYNFFEWSVAFIKREFLCMSPHLGRQVECLHALSFVDYDHVFDYINELSNVSWPTVGPATL